MKNTAKALLFTALLIGAGFLAIDGMKSATAEDKEKPEETPRFLFVQNASGLEYEDGKITLEDVNSETIFFSDRPNRIAGHTPTAVFVKEWSLGEDSFAANNPNATLAVFGEKQEPMDAVVVLSNPTLDDDDLTYDVKILEGEIPESGEACSLFIDIIGRPMTPLSVAGVARRTTRRTTRRHMIYQGAAAGSYPYAGTPYAGTRPNTVIVNIDND